MKYLLFAFLFLLPLQAHAANDIVNDATLSTNLISCWDLEESSGTRIDAVTANNNDLTDNNAVLSGTGVSGNAADFELSQNQYLSITDASQNNLDLSGDFSAMAWINLEQLPSTAGASFSVISKFTSDQAYRVLLLDTGEVQAYVSDDGTSSNRDFFTSTENDLIDSGDLGNYRQLIVTYDVSARTFVAYWQGSSVTGTNSHNGIVDGINNSSAPFVIGAYNGGASLYMDGLLDTVAIWDRVLDTDDVSDLYNSGTGIPCAGESDAPYLHFFD